MSKSWSSWLVQPSVPSPIHCLNLVDWKASVDTCCTFHVLEYWKTYKTGLEKANSQGLYLLFVLDRNDSGTEDRCKSKRMYTKYPLCVLWPLMTYGEFSSQWPRWTLPNQPRIRFYYRIPLDYVLSGFFCRLAATRVQYSEYVFLCSHSTIPTSIGGCQGGNCPRGLGCCPHLSISRNSWR